MYENRITNWLNPAAITVGESMEPSTPIQMASAQDIYQLAAARAYHDHQLDRLFNAEYYGDCGSGIKRLVALKVSRQGAKAQRVG